MIYVWIRWSLNSSVRLGVVTAAIYSRDLINECLIFPYRAKHMSAKLMQLLHVNQSQNRHNFRMNSIPAPDFGSFSLYVLTCHTILSLETRERPVPVCDKPDKHASCRTNGVRNICPTEFSQEPSTRIVPSKHLNIVIRTPNATWTERIIRTGHCIHRLWIVETSKSIMILINLKHFIDEIFYLKTEIHHHVRINWDKMMKCNTILIDKVIYLPSESWCGKNWTRWIFEDPLQWWSYTAGYARTHWGTRGTQTRQNPR